MKQIISLIAALTVSASAYAGISDGNPDMYGWVVDDHQLQDGRQMAYKEPVLPFGAPDQHGGILFNQGGDRASASPAEVGIGDSYGSVLHDVGFSW